MTLPSWKLLLIIYLTHFTPPLVKMSSYLASVYQMYRRIFISSSHMYPLTNW